MREFLENLEKKLRYYKKQLECQIEKEEQGEPDLASPEKPKGLDSKRKPVTHDECGRPFGKDELDDKIKAKMHAEMTRRNFGEADATAHVIDRDRGEKVKPKPEPLMHSENEDKKHDYDNDGKLDAHERHHKEIAEAIKYDSNGQWKLEKSDYGPKGMGQYTPADNIKRKMKNTGEAFEDAGKNVNAKKYTTSGSSMQQAHEAAQIRDQKAKTKASTKVFSDEEKRALEEKMRSEGRIK